MSAAVRALMALALWALCGAAFADPTVASIDGKLAEREVLVMLRVPAQHYRPGADYSGNYESLQGRAARLRVAEELAARFGLRIVDSWPMPALAVDCFVMEVKGLASIEPLVENLARDARVESVQRMNLYHALAHDDPLYALQPTAKPWHLDEIHRLATGKNVRVATIDSGVELDHPDLIGRVVISHNFVDARANVAETHGTAVAGIIAARADNAVGIVGVAPDAALMALRACWQIADDGNASVCSSFTLAKALQFALDNRAKVINMSLGGPPDRLLARLLEVAGARGIVIVAAVDPRFTDGGFPASFPGALAVAADDVQDSPTTIYLAPGRDIPTTLPGRRWGFVGGSSFAAAEVAGLVALLLDLAPNQKPQQIRDSLDSSELPISSPRRHAIVDACAAVARTMGACPCGCTVARSETPQLVR